MNVKEVTIKKLKKRMACLVVTHFTMLTRQDTKQIVKVLRELEWFEILNKP